MSISTAVRWFRIFGEKSRGRAWRNLENRFVVVAVAIVIASSFVSIMRRAVSRRFLDCLVDRSGLVDVHVRWFLREVVNVLVSKSQGCARRMGDNRFVVVAVAIVIASSSVSIMRRAVSRRFLDCLVDRSGLVDARWFIGCLDLRSLLVGVLAWSWSLREDVLVDLLRARALIGKTPVSVFVCLSVS